MTSLLDTSASDDFVATHSVTMNQKAIKRPGMTLVIQQTVLGSIPLKVTPHCRKINLSSSNFDKSILIHRGGHTHNRITPTIPAVYGGELQGPATNVIVDLEVPFELGFELRLLLYRQIGFVYTGYVE
jgi:hypothetical protein